MDAIYLDLASVHVAIVKDLGLASSRLKVYQPAPNTKNKGLFAASYISEECQERQPVTIVDEMFHPYHGLGCQIFIYGPDISSPHPTVESPTNE
jgi:hypothetical protein